MLFFFGILLPIIALAVEVSMNASADIYVDPIPTWWHTLLVASVPALNAICMLAVSRGASHRRTTWLVLNGLAIAIGGVYALIYVPISIFAVFGVMFFGYGLLPLSPILSFVCSLAICSQILQLTQHELPRRKPWNTSLAFGLSIVLGIAAIAAGELPSWITEQGVQLAVRGSDNQREQGLYLLRNFSSDVELASQLRRNRPRRLLGITRGVGGMRANNLFFRVTGKQLSSMLAEGNESDFLWRRPFDAGLGGEEVADRVEDLFMRTSRMDTKIDAETSVAYTEWTMAFRNDSIVAQEARAQILLPPGAVVSRLTLWINGEPREAAFSSTGKVRSAYQEVAVVRRRDPVLVTWKGKDRVLMQCFPVPANSGTMKVRLGITAPVTWSAESGAIELPRIIERNFEAKNLKHTVWADSDSELAANNDQLTPKSKGDQFALAGGLTSKQLATTELKIMQPPRADSFKVETEDVILAGSMQEQRQGQPKHLIFLVDGSLGMRSRLQQIAESIQTIAELTRVDVLFAGDQVSDLTSFANDAKQLADAMKSNASAGGCDNSAALVEAWDSATNDSEIVWIHGVQPLLTRNNDALDQRIKNDFTAPTLWDLQLRTGPNRVMERFHDRLEVERISSTGDVKSDLNTWWTSLEEPTWNVAWEKSERSAGEELISQPRAGDLWAFARVGKLLRKSVATPGKTFALRDEATKFAAASHLVTPVSGAVVLETQAQYDRHGLVPEDQKFKQTVVTPEPSSGLLMLLSILPVVHWVRRQRRRR